MNRSWFYSLKLIYPFYVLGLFFLVISLAFGLLAPTVQASSPQGPFLSGVQGQTQGKAVLPIIVCATHNSDGTFTAIWGYQNKNDAKVTIPVGDKNYVSPGAQGQGQPTQFSPGEHHDTFKTTYTEDQVITWTLVGPDGQKHSAKADDGTKRCPKEGGEATATRVPTEKIEATQIPTEAPQPTQAPTDVPAEATATRAATRHPSATPTQESIAVVSTPTATQGVIHSNPTPTATSRTIHTNPTPTNTSVPAQVVIATLPPPSTPQASQTQALIPVTGAADHSAGEVDGLLQKIFMNLGLALLGLGIILHGTWIKISRSSR